MLASRNRRGSTIGLDRTIQERGTKSDEVAKTNRRDSAHVAKKEVKSSLGRKGGQLVPRKILSTTFSSEIDDSRERSALGRWKGQRVGARGEKADGLTG